MYIWVLNPNQLTGEPYRFIVKINRFVIIVFKIESNMR